MSMRSIIGGSVRVLLIAAATGAAAFGALAVFQPFGKAAVPAPVVTVVGTPAATALQGRIESARVALRETEATLDNVKSTSPASTLPANANLRAQYEAQIAAATERRDLSLRHAAAIRQAIEAGIAPSSLAEIRDSVVIGQLLTQQTALDAQIAVEGARLKSNHPTMLALHAQRTALATQVGKEAVAIATALEAEAKIDDTQIKLLETQLPTEAPSAAPIDTSALEAEAAAQRAELDSLVDAYFNVPPVVTATQEVRLAQPLSLANLAVVGVAVFAAMLFQILLAVRRRRPHPAQVDATVWDEDDDPEVVIVEDPMSLRKAS